MEFRVARTAATTGNLLAELVRQGLREANVAEPANAVVCYGAGYSGTSPALNGRCSSLDKLQQTKRLREVLGEGALEVFDTPAAAEAACRTGKVLLSRHLVHSRGRDIGVVLEPWQVTPRIQSGARFFTTYVPSVREFRVWAYRKRHLGTYVKELRRGGDFKKLGRNHDNGFDFSGQENPNVPEGLKDIARGAVAALGLDFGAVDIVETADGRYVVLEVNSAPGVSNERRRVIVGLAQRVVRWIVADCPGRS